MKYTVSVDLSGIAVDASKILAGAMPAVEHAVMAIGNEAMVRWKMAVMHADLWQGEKEAYVNSIELEKTGPFAIRVYTDYKNAGPIETGRPAFDQHAYLQTSLKTRIVKGGPNKGKKYLIIPFRHNTPGQTAHAPAMPDLIYKAALQLNKSRITGQRLEDNIHKRRDAKGNILQVTRNTYKWGGALPAGIVPKTHEHHKTDRYAGMVRMDTSTGKKKSSAYLTFRTMMEGSGGWITPAKPGLYLARGVSQEIEPLASTAIQAAFYESVKAALKS